jgi:hypothetical protein
MNERLRWVAVIPSAIGGWLIAFVVSLMLYRVANHLCPSEYFISGYCMAPWFRYVERAILFIGAALSAVLVVALPAFVAPSRRRTVAWSALCIGTVAAASIGWPMPAELFAAVIAGIVTAFVVQLALSSHNDA